MFSLSHIFCLALYITFISYSAKQLSNHDPQYYKLLNITRNFSKDDLARANRKILRNLHPDHKHGDQTKFMIHNEIIETFKQMPKSLLKIYNMFHEDIYVLFNNKSQNSSFDTLKKVKENESIMLHGFALLLTMFVMKFAKIKSQKAKTSVLVSFVSSFLIEAIFFNYFSNFEEYQTLLLDFLDNLESFNQYTFFEILMFVKFSIFFIQQTGIMFCLPLIVDKPMNIMRTIEELENILDEEVWTKKKLSKPESKFNQTK
jgi:hypothetical protein